MKKKNNLLFKICHILLIFIGVALNLYMLFTSSETILLESMHFFRLAAFIASLVYMLNGYEKSADLFYKMFMWFLGISTIISYTSFISLGYEMSLFNSFITVMILVAFIFIIGAKDYGKVKSNIISITLAILNIINVITIYKSTNNILNLNVLIASGQLILALTAAIMVWVKYIDKDSRGAKI